MTSSYKYQPLSSPSTQIRLLELLPGRGIIQCRLKVTELEEAQDTYEAISYCWKAYTRESWFGSTYKEKKKQKRFRVRIDEANFYITENLHGALLQMRSESRARVLWADAICINQEDDKEKSAQVAMMAQIYKGGFRTLAWLGEADHGTRRAFHFLKECANRQSQDTSQSSPLEHLEPEIIPSISRMSSSPAIYRLLPVVWDWFRERRVQVSVESIFGRPYFRRTWVVQEIAKSSCVLFLCGKFVIPWVDLSNAFSELNYWMPSGDSFSALGDILRSLCDYDLMEVVMMASSTQASDPRDKLYGVLGLVPGGGKTADITIDYDREPVEVFYNFTKGLLLFSTKLAVLSMSYGCSPNKPRHVPSWVWNPQPDEPYGRFSLPYPNEYQAALDSVSQPSFCDRMLGLRGIVLHTVTAVSSVWNPESPPNLRFPTNMASYTLRVLLWYFEFRAIGNIDQSSLDPATAESRKDIWFRTVWPTEFSQKPLTIHEQSEHTRRMMKFTRFDSEMVDRFGKYVSEGKKPPTTWTKFKLLSAISTLTIRRLLGNLAAKKFEDRMPPYMYPNNRRLARTDGGHIALCPKETSINDKVVLLQGSDVPFLVRPIGEHWQIVGECYFHALMDGSAWDESRCEMLWIE